MVRSMTGFARCEAGVEQGRLSWELRSVNHRYLDLNFKLPDEFRALEPEWRLAAAGAIARGKVELTLRHAPETAAPVLEVDAERLQALCAALDTVTGIAGATLAADPVSLLAWPGVVRQSAVALAPLQAAASHLFTTALAQFADTRTREGARLAEHIEARADQLELHAEALRLRAPLMREANLKRLRGRLADLGAELEPARLAQEAALMAQRLDVDEELARLSIHLGEVRKTLGGREPGGRRLDFLMQELNRETNTIASKSQDAESTRLAVDMKVLIEQMREQVQNIE